MELIVRFLLFHSNFSYMYLTLNTRFESNISNNDKRIQISYQSIHCEIRLSNTSSGVDDSEFGQVFFGLTYPLPLSPHDGNRCNPNFYKDLGLCRPEIEAGRECNRTEQCTDHSKCLSSFTPGASSCTCDVTHYEEGGRCVEVKYPSLKKLSLRSIQIL